MRLRGEWNGFNAEKLGEPRLAAIIRRKTTRSHAAPFIDAYPDHPLVSLIRCPSYRFSQNTLFSSLIPASSPRHLHLQSIDILNYLCRQPMLEGLSLSSPKDLMLNEYGKCWEENAEDQKDIEL